MRQMVLSLVFLGVVSAAPQVFARELTVTCGKNAYEALKYNRLEDAEFLMKLKTQGPYNPPLVVNFVDDGQDKTRNVTKVELKNNQAVVELRFPTEKYTISDLKCDDIETATPKAVYEKYVGGFAGWDMPIEANCSCAWMN